jgi:hypothetical protein
VRITGAHWPASARWTRDVFVDLYGQLVVDVAPAPYASLYGGLKTSEVKATSSPGEGGGGGGGGGDSVSRAGGGGVNSGTITASTFVGQEMGTHHRATQPRYVFDSKILWRNETLASDLVPPWLDNAHIILKQFILGPRGSGAYPHFHNAAINALAHGEKRWCVDLICSCLHLHM